MIYAYSLSARSLQLRLLACGCLRCLRYLRERGSSNIAGAAAAAEQPTERAISIYRTVHKTNYKDG